MTISTQDPEFGYTDRHSAGIVSLLRTLSTSLSEKGALSRTLTGQLETRRAPHGPQTRPSRAPQTRCPELVETRRSPQGPQTWSPKASPTIAWFRRTPSLVHLDQPCASERQFSTAETLKGADPRTEHGATSHKLLVGSAGVRSCLPGSLLLCFLACWWAVRHFCVLSCRFCLARLRWLPS